jgi:hypothetical protein
MGGTVLSDDGVDDLEWVVVEESEDMEELTEAGGGASAQTPICLRSLAVSSPNGLLHSPPASTGVQSPLHVPIGAAGEENAAAAAAAAAAATSPPASALQALKTQADRCGLQFRCEDERVSEQEWRARIVLTTSAGPVTELPWSGVCLGLKRAKQAAAELALDCMPQQPQAASTTPSGSPAQSSALQDLKTVLDRQQERYHCEEQRVSEQEWRARIVLLPSERRMLASELAWSEVCLGRGNAKQAAAAIALMHLRP